MTFSEAIARAEALAKDAKERAKADGCMFPEAYALGAMTAHYALELQAHEKTRQALAGAHEASRPNFPDAQ